jgi:glycosyltransferase involved in cell wall biosynthesis
MKISVVIPTYNRGYIVAEAIKSALAQTHRAFEILVVNDGSTDGSEDVIEYFVKYNGIKHLKHSKNRGCSAAYNTGLDAATGTLIAFLDSDDLWRPFYLARHAEFFCREPELDASFSDTEVRGDREYIPSLIDLMPKFTNLLGNQTRVKEHILDIRQFYLCLLEEVPVKPSALVFKRSLYSRFGGFDEAWPSGTDWDLFIRFARTSRFGYIGEPLVTQRRTHDATHQLFRERDKIFLIDVLKRERSIRHSDPAALSAINLGLFRQYNNLGNYYLRSGERKKALATYLQGFKQTGQPGMALRAMASYLPTQATGFLKSMVAGRR